MLVLKTTLGFEELQKRCDEVFLLNEDDVCYNVGVDEGGVVHIEMDEVDEDGDVTSFTYHPDMSERPEALQYLLGLRNDFND